MAACLTHYEFGRGLDAVAPKRRVPAFESIMHAPLVWQLPAERTFLHTEVSRTQHSRRPLIKGCQVHEPGSELNVEYVRLRYPTIADNSQPGELKDHVDKAIRVLDAYLEKNSKE